MNQAMTSKIWSVKGLKGMTYDQFASVLDQLAAKPDIGEKVVFLDVNEIYNVVDLQSDHARNLLFQEINKNTTRR